MWRKDTPEMQILNITAVLFVTVVVAVMGATAVWHFSGTANKFLLNGQLFRDEFIKCFVCAIFYGLQTGVIVSVTLSLYKRSIFYLSFMYAAIIQPLSYIDPILTAVLASVLPAIFILLRSIQNKKIKRTFIRLVTISAILISYQIISLIVRAGVAHFGYAFDIAEDLPVIVISAEQLLIMAVVYIKGGVADERWDYKLVLYPAGRASLRRSAESGANVQAYAALVGLERVIAGIVVWGFQAVQWLIILFLCALAGVLAEGLVITAAFVVYGVTCIQRRPHCKPLHCTLISTGVFLAAASTVPPLRLSWFLPVLVGLAIVYAMYRVAIYTDEVAAMRLRLAVPPFCCATATPDAIRDRGIRAGLKDDDIDFLIDAHRLAHYRKTLADKYGITAGAVKQKKRRLTARLDE